MYKKTVTFVNFDGETVTETYEFNLMKSELMELELSEKDGFSDAMQKIIEKEDGKKIIAGFKTILLMAVGERRGNSFVKNDQIREMFEGSPAFSEIFMEFATNAEAGAEFINGVIPKDLAEAGSKTELAQKMKAKIDSMGVKDVPLPLEIPTPDFASMTTEQFEAWKNGM